MHTRHRRLLSALGYLIRKPVKALKAIHRDRFAPRYWQEYVHQTYGFHEGLPQVDIFSLAGSDDTFKETVSPFAFLEASSTPMDLALLKLLARRFDNCRYLEIGRWRGESLLNVASVAGECVSVSLSPEQMRENGFSESMIAQDGFYPKRLPDGMRNVTFVNEDTQTFDLKRLNAKFDLIFVDGDHHSAAVASDTRQVFELLRDERSMIVWHDYASTPERVRWPVFAGILDGCPQEARKHIYHVSNTMCALYTREALQTTMREFAMTPESVFSMTIQGERLQPQQE